MAVHFDDISSMTASDFGSVLAGVMAQPFVKGALAIGLWGCTALGLPVDLAIVMVVLFLTDFVLGVAVAWRRGRFSCRKFMRGAAKIPVYTLLLLVSWVCQRVVQEVLGHSLPVPLWTAAYLSMHDAVSVVAKCALLGLPVPPAFRRAAKRVGKAVDETVDNALDKVDPPPKDDGAFRKF